MKKTKADKILYILFGVITMSWLFGVMLPNFRIIGLSVFTLLGGIAAVALVGHIYFNVAPADRAARDKRNASKQ